MQLHPKAKILLISSNIWYFGEGLLGPLFAVFTERVGGDILDISWAWATYMFVTGFFTIIFGKIADNIDKEKMIVFGYSLNALFTFSYLLVSSPVHLLLVQAGLGLALSLSNPTWLALYDRYSGDKNDGYVWGLSDGQAKIVSGLGILVGGFLVSMTSFTVLFVCMGVIQTWAALHQARILSSRHR